MPTEPRSSEDPTARHRETWGNWARCVTGAPVLLAAAAAGALGIASTGTAQVIDFTLSPESGLTGSLELTVANAGSLIGDWDEVTNPDGTRTKPGIFGTFGPTENVPVPVDLDLEMGGPLATGSAGGFRLTLDTSAESVSMTGYEVDFLASGAAALPASVTMLFSSFRTRAPDSTFIGGFPLTLPIGEIELVSMSAIQAGPAAGTLTPIGPTTWEVALLGTIELTLGVEGLGAPFELPPTPLALFLQGEVSLDGSDATFSALTALEVEISETPGAELPQFPLPLPTILPAGGTANLLMDLVLEELTAALLADLSTIATGTTQVCIADCDGSGTLDFFDFLCFQAQFAAGDPRADCDGSGSLDFFDFLCFQAAFAAGCP